MSLTYVVQIYAILLIAGLPLLAARESLNEEELEQLGGDRRAVYLSGAISLALVAGVTVLVAAWQGIEAAALGWRTGAIRTDLAWAVGATAAGLVLAWGVSLLLRRLGFTESPLALLLLPRTPGEKWAFVVLALAAGLCEEYVYRGFALHVLEAWSGSTWVAVVVTSVSFGLAHGYQRLAGILRATLLGFILAAPVVATGSLFAAIVAHFWINAAIGLGGWRRLIPEEQLPD